MDRVQASTPGDLLTPIVRKPVAETKLQAIAHTVNRHIGRAAQEIIAAGLELLKAKHGPRAVGHGQFERLFQDHPHPVKEPVRFSSRYGQKLMTIAQHAVLSKGEHRSLLPPAVTTLYALAQLPAATVQRALTSGLIHPEMQERDVVGLRSPAARVAQVRRRTHEPSADAIEREMSDTIRRWWQRYPQARPFLLEEIAAVAGRPWADAVDDRTDDEPAEDAR